MRTHFIRLMFAAALLVASAVASFAQQPMFRGKVVDEAGKPVPDAVMAFAAQFLNLTRTDKTDSKGEYLMIGLPSGEFADHDEKGRRRRGHRQDADHAGPEHTRHAHLAASGARRCARRGGGSRQPRWCSGQGHAGAAGAGQDGVRRI